MDRNGAGSNFVGAAQVGYLNTLFAALFLLGRHLGAVNALVTDNPGKWATLLANRLLQEH